MRCMALFHRSCRTFTTRRDPCGSPQLPDGRLQITEYSCLRVRLADDAVRCVLPLAGKRLAVGDALVRLGVPRLQSLVAAPSLIARLVTFKNADTPERFLATAQVKLADLGVNGKLQLPVHVQGERVGTPVRRVVRVRGVTIPGYSLIVAELSSSDSLLLQESGLGGRTRLGCGFFNADQEP